MIYTVYLPPREYMPQDHANDDGESMGLHNLVLVPEGLAKWALVFAPFWLLFHRLWWALSLYILYVIFSIALLFTDYHTIVLFLNGLPGLYLLLEGHQLRRQNLDMRGFHFLGVVEGHDEKTAIERFLHLHKSEIETMIADLKKPENSGFLHQSLKKYKNDQGIGLFSESGA